MYSDTAGKNFELSMVEGMHTCMSEFVVAECSTHQHLS
jgi:hypothetical protein